MIYLSGFERARTVLSFFVFQAEDGIRDPLVTGVQTCALPIAGCTRCSCPASQASGAAEGVEIGQPAFGLLDQPSVCDRLGLPAGLGEQLASLTGAGVRLVRRGVLQPLVGLDDQLEDLVRLHPSSSRKSRPRDRRMIVGCRQRPGGVEEPGWTKTWGRGSPSATWTSSAPGWPARPSIGGPGWSCSRWAPGWPSTAWISGRITSIPRESCTAGSSP